MGIRILHMATLDVKAVQNTATQKQINCKSQGGNTDKTDREAPTYAAKWDLAAPSASAKPPASK